jgi:hypothetical protein
MNTATGKIIAQGKRSMYCQLIPTSWRTQDTVYAPARWLLHFLANGMSGKIQHPKTNDGNP